MWFEIEKTDQRSQRKKSNRIWIQIECEFLKDEIVVAIKWTQRFEEKKNVHETVFSVFVFIFLINLISEGANDK